MTKYTVDGSVIEAIEAIVDLLNSKDLNDVSRANKAFPALIASMRMCPEEPTFDPQKGFAHVIYNTEIGTLKNMLYSWEKGTELLNEIGNRPKLKLSLVSRYPMPMEMRKRIKKDGDERNQ